MHTTQDPVATAVDAFCEACMQALARAFRNVGPDAPLQKAREVLEPRGIFHDVATHELRKQIRRVLIIDGARTLDALSAVGAPGLHAVLADVIATTITAIIDASKKPACIDCGMPCDDENGAHLCCMDCQFTGIDGPPETGPGWEHREHFRQLAIEKRERLREAGVYHGQDPNHLERRRRRYAERKAAGEPGPW